MCPSSVLLCVYAATELVKTKRRVAVLVWEAVEQNAFLSTKPTDKLQLICRSLCKLELQLYHCTMFQQKVCSLEKNDAGLPFKDPAQTVMWLPQPKCQNNILKTLARSKGKIVVANFTQQPQSRLAILDLGRVLFRVKQSIQSTVAFCSVELPSKRFLKHQTRVAFNGVKRVIYWRSLHRSRLPQRTWKRNWQCHCLHIVRLEVFWTCSNQGVKVFIFWISCFHNISTAMKMATSSSPFLLPPFPLKGEFCAVHAGVDEKYRRLTVFDQKVKPLLPNIITQVFTIWHFSRQHSAFERGSTNPRLQFQQYRRGHCIMNRHLRPLELQACEGCVITASLLATIVTWHQDGRVLLRDACKSRNHDVCFQFCRWKNRCCKDRLWLCVVGDFKPGYDSKVRHNSLRRRSSLIRVGTFDLYILYWDLLGAQVLSSLTNSTLIGNWKKTVTKFDWTQNVEATLWRNPLAANSDGVCGMWTLHPPKSMSALGPFWYFFSLSIPSNHIFHALPPLINCFRGGPLSSVYNCKVQCSFQIYVAKLQNLLHRRNPRCPSRNKTTIKSPTQTPPTGLELTLRHPAHEGLT